MTRFIVETFAPAADSAALETIVGQVRAATGATLRGRVVHERSYLVPGDETCFHIFVADSAADVEALAHDAGLEIDRLTEALVSREDAGELNTG